MPSGDPAYTASELADLQLEGLQWTVYHAYHGSPLYREKLDAAGIAPGDVRSLDDLKRLPFTEKKDLHAYYPFGSLAVPEEKVVRLHASSGTTGRRTVAYYTSRDLDDWAEMMARCMRYAGVTPQDRVHITPAYGLWTAGVSFQTGAERLGAMAVPVGPASTDLQLELLLEFRSTVLTSTSSYALYLGEEIERRGLSGRHSLRVGIIGSERWSDAMRRRIEQLLGIESFDIIGMTETYGPGTGLDCHLHSGIHYWSDYLLFEVIDPETGEVLPEGEEGELVVTSLRKEASPLIRYRTRDITRLLPGRCECGSPFPRIDRILGRTDDAIKVRGVLFYPGHVDEILSRTEGVSSEYRIVLTREGGKDSVLLRVEEDPQAGKDRAQVQQELARRLHDTLRLRVDVEVVDFGALPRSERKTRRVIDERVM